MEKRLSIIVVPHDNAKTRSYSISYRLLYLFTTLTVLLALVLVIFVATYARVLYAARKAWRLEAEKKVLVSQLAQVDSLRSELMRIEAMSIQIKKMLGVELSPADSLVMARLSAVAHSPAAYDEGEVEEVPPQRQKQLLKAVPSLWPTKGFVTRKFKTTGGERSADYHPGIDIAAKEGTPVKASADGVVVTSTWDDTYGYMVVIDHGFGIQTLYGHNSRNLVKVGDRVKRGQTIGFVGSTGKSTAPHLHFEVRKNALPEDPMKYLLD